MNFLMTEWEGPRVGLGHPPGSPHLPPHLLKKKDRFSRQRCRARRAESTNIVAAEAAVKRRQLKQEVSNGKTINTRAPLIAKRQLWTKFKK